MPTTTSTAMTAARSWPVGAYRFEVTVRRDRQGAAAEVECVWSPAEPAQLSPFEWRQFTAGRNHALGEIAAVLGLNAGVLEL